MIGGRRVVRESARAFRSHFAGFRPIDVAVSPFMTERRKAARRLPSRLPSQCRAFQALGVLGVRIWASQPKLFGGMVWMRRRATVGAFVAGGGDDAERCAE